MRLRIAPVTDATVGTWRDVHNAVIPAAQLSTADVRDRRRRYLLSLASVEGEVVGNATARPPVSDGDPFTVIVRILPRHRRHGLGTAYLRAALEQVQALGASRVETVVLAANADGLAFALRHGFVESERYTLDVGAEYVHLRLRL